MRQNSPIGFGYLPDVVKNLIIINVLFFVATLIFNIRGINLMRILGAYYPESPYFQPFQLVTHMFMHSDWGHIILNMFSLWIFGSVLEQTWGAKKFLVYFLSTGLGALAIYMGVQYLECQNFIDQINNFPFNWDGFYEALTLTYDEDIYRELDSLIKESGVSVEPVGKLFKNYITPVLGASGATYGLLIGVAYLYPNMELMMLFLPISIKVKYIAAALIIYSLYKGTNGFDMDQVAHFAHLGGAIFGLICFKIWENIQ